MEARGLFAGWEGGGRHWLIINGNQSAAERKAD
jgi:hypothetical protein